MYTWLYFWTLFYSMRCICLFFFLHCHTLDYCNFLQGSGTCNLIHLKNCFSSSSSFVFPYKFLSQLIHFYKYTETDQVFIESVDERKKILHCNNIEFHFMNVIFLHLFRSLISFLNILQFVAQRFCTHFKFISVFQF